MGAEATARDMRRAARKLIGDQGVQIIERHSAILNEHAISLNGLLASDGKQGAQIAAIEVRRHIDRRMLDDFIGRDWRARLRWLFTGA